MWFAVLEPFEMGAGVVCMAGMTAATWVVAASTALIVVSAVTTVSAMVAAAVGFVGRGITVGVDSQSRFAGVGIGFEGLALEELGEKGTWSVTVFAVPLGAGASASWHIPSASANSVSMAAMLVCVWPKLWCI